MNRRRNAKVRCWTLVGLLLLAAVWLGPQPARAANLLADVSASGPSVDFLPYLTTLDAPRRDATLEMPTGTQQITMALNAKGEGPTFRWLAGGFSNSGPTPRDMVIVIADQGFVGSGFAWPKSPGNHVENIVTAGPIALQPLNVAGKQAYAFTLPAGASAAVAVEIAGPSLAAVTLWQRPAFDEQKDYFAFFRGSLLGIAVLLSLAMFGFYVFRPRPVFLAAGGFAASAVAFMLLEAGHVPVILGALHVPLSVATARALIEGLLAAFLVLYLVFGTELRRLMPIAGNTVLGLGALAFAVPLYGFADPAAASGVARLLFAAVAIAGLALVVVLWRRGEDKAETQLLPFAAILLWTFIAFVAALADPSSGAVSPVLLAGLCAVLVVMGFTLAHDAFSQGYLSRHFFREAGRRALALAGARAYVWDWQPEEGELHIGEEIERALSLEPGILADVGVEGFLELMHPSDRPAYLAAVESAEEQGNGTIDCQFRLRHDDGSYLWYQLRARAMPGPDQRAMRCIGTLTDVHQARVTEDRLLNDAVHDFVTGLPNRALFEDRVERALAAAQASKHPVSIYVLLVDIDRFKAVNDGLGHEAGDSLLTVIGRRLTTELEPGDSLARLPGDQFAILVPDAPGNRDITAFSEAVRRTVARPISLDGQDIVLTACVGVAHNREPALTAAQLLKDAAIALYEAKRHGGGSIEVFRTSMRDDRAELVVLEQELRRAIERSEFEVHYQPIARLADMNLAGFEALVRWRHPALGLLAPESFIGLAEQTGMIKDIGRAVLNEAGRQLGIWQRAYRPAEPLFVAVNISSAQLIEASLIEDIKLVLHREGVRRGSLKIEVTESLVMQYPERAGQILERFRELGVGLACDDFGTGYSSLSTLRKLPFDTIKVDRSFIATDASDERATIILEAIVAMGHALGLTIVAEGIENQNQVDRLGHLNCDLGQGYFIGRPMTTKQVNDALAGLPYAASSGRTAITWLWEKASRDPAPVPALQEMTAARIAEQRTRKAAADAARQPPAEPKQPPAQRPVAEMAPPPAPQPEPEKAALPEAAPDVADSEVSEEEEPAPDEAGISPDEARRERRRKRKLAEQSPP